MLRSKLSVFLFAVSLACGGFAVKVRAQEVEETLRVRTRVVFLDALVRDKRTRGLATDLKAENFEVLADGKPRAISYFSREGDAGRKPLALVVVLDLRRSGAGRFLRRTEILEAMAAELAKLPAQDEVALMVLEAGGADEKREWLAPLTRNRAQIASALAVVPTLVAEGSPGDGGDPNAQPTQEGMTISATIGGDSDKEKKKKEEKKAADGEKAETANAITAAAEGVEKAASEIEAKARDEADRKQQEESAGVPVNKSGIRSQTVSVGKDGDTVTHTVYNDGQSRTRRVSKSGNVDIEIDTEFDIAGAINEVAEVVTKERPNSQAAIVWVSDGIVPVFYAERDVVEAKLAKSNIIFSALVADMKFGFKLFKPVLKPLGNWVGLSIYGSSQHLAKQSGGEAIRVNRPADYANGLNKIIGNLTGRYSLGFTITENEQDDGLMHPLEVRVRARDAKGKERKLEVVSRRGYYMPKENETAQKQN